MAELTLEERVEALELELKELRQHWEIDKPDEPRGWQKIVGVFADNPEFEEAVLAGRKWREDQTMLSEEVTEQKQKSVTEILPCRSFL